MSNTAIIFTGTGRSLQYTHSNIKEMLISSIEDCDVFVLIAKTAHVSNVELLLDIPQLRLLSVEKEPDYDTTKYKFRPGFPPKTCSPKIYASMINQRKNANNMLSDYERHNGVTYDTVLFSRLDVKYFWPVKPHIQNLDMTKLYVPNFHNTFGGVIDGYNDRFAISNRKNMEVYFTLPDALDKYLSQGRVIDPETFLKWHLLDNKIEVNHIPVRFGRVRPNGQEIDLRLVNTTPIGDM